MALFDLAPIEEDPDLLERHAHCEVRCDDDGNVAVFLRGSLAFTISPNDIVIVARSLGRVGHMLTAALSRQSNEHDADLCEAMLAPDFDPTEGADG